jgi:hypothetical protein
LFGTHFQSSFTDSTDLHQQGIEIKYRRWLSGPGDLPGRIPGPTRAGSGSTGFFNTLSLLMWIISSHDDRKPNCPFAWQLSSSISLSGTPKHQKEPKTPNDLFYESK